MFLHRLERRARARDGARNQSSTTTWLVVVPAIADARIARATAKTTTRARREGKKEKHARTRGPRSRASHRIASSSAHLVRRRMALEWRLRSRASRDFSKT
jgi:hypothetical protein